MTNSGRATNEMYLKGTQETNELLYRHFAPKMYGICLRFAGNPMDADDILQEAFLKIFMKIKDFRNEGSLEGWIRRTFVNTAINYYRKNSRNQRNGDLDGIDISDDNTEIIYDKLSREELLNLLQELPIGYRTVFNLNVLEGYTHKEIGEMLGISDNTSKSQLTRARAILQKRVRNMVRERIKIPFEDFKIIRNHRTAINAEPAYSEAV
jgi:RNA polymerase sigma-70 factor (ECF subfamily)